MSALVCANCGGVTNTAVCNHLDPIREDGKANVCWLRWENNTWVKGCAYDTCDSFMKPIIDHFLYSVSKPTNQIPFEEGE